ncbi:hypothetical protein DFH11DRAFT_1507063 [Phellopilus nigrolimitatus]|nr:hypothetical protein DFH11DRAFT_1507063 [Phellopilus nigrolimitatus]
MSVVNASTCAFVAAAILIVGPWLYFLLPPSPSRHTQTRVKAGASNDDTQTRPRTLLSLFIAMHSLCILYALIVLFPQNIFSRLRIPLSEPADAIRARLLHFARSPTLPGPLETLLVRLQSFDARVVYVRFGHAALQDCAHCVSRADFALYAFPGPLLEYVCEAAAVGLVTIRGSGRERLRIWALAALAAAACAEAYFVSATDVVFPASRDGSGEAAAVATVMLHDTAQRLRHALFLLLPPLLHLLPPSRARATSPLTALPQILAQAERTRARLQLLRLASAARSRAPAVRGASERWWSRQRAEGACALGDREVREMAVKLGLDLGGAADDGAVGEGALRAGVRTGVGALLGGFRPSEYM